MERSSKEDQTRLREPYHVSYSGFLESEGLQRYRQNTKSQNRVNRYKTTPISFTRAFLTVLLREKVDATPERNRMLYGLLYEVLCWLRYNDTNMAPWPTFSNPDWNFFPLTMLEFALVFENAIKKFCRLWPNTWKNFWVRGIPLCMLGAGIPLPLLILCAETSPPYTTILPFQTAVASC